MSASTSGAEQRHNLSTRGRLLDAAEQLLGQPDAPRLTLDCVAAAAGLSRTTAYRIFGSNAEMAAAVAASRLEAHRHSILDVARREPDAVSKLVAMIIYTVVTIAHDPALSRLFEDDNLGGTLPLHSLANELARPIAQQGQVSGEIRRDVAVDEILDWLIEITIAISRQHHDEEAVRRRVSVFVRPGLVHHPPAVATLDLIGRAEEKLLGALELVGKLRGTAEQTEGD